MEIAFVRDCEHRAESFEINVLRFYLVMRGQTQMAGRTQHFLRIFARNLKHRGLGRPSLSIDQVHDRALVLANYSGMRFGNEVAD